ncbi:MAG: AAA family ATPase [Methanoregula sp.]|nr:AAA family ATPase [Methanoregula sp.]MDD5187456.1 AAA family ATPase [Methanoregula sp.]
MTTLDRVQIRGYKSIDRVDITIGRINVLIGGNGSGKSNFLSLFSLMQEIAKGQFQRAVLKRGRATTLLHYGTKTTKLAGTRLTFGTAGYLAVWEPTDDDTLIFNRESVFRETATEKQPSLFDIDSTETGHQGFSESRLAAPGALPDTTTQHEILDSIQDWKTYHFHDTSETAPVRMTCRINDNVSLRQDASNLAAILYLLKKTALPQYEKIRNTIRLVAPFFDDFIVRPTPDNPEYIRLEWRETGCDLPLYAHQLSDGTLRFICLATLLLQPETPSLILIDEPELGLHPSAINLLGDLIRYASSRSQLIITTQSERLLDCFNPDEILIVDRVDGHTTIFRPDLVELGHWLNEYTLGNLWAMNILTIRPGW